MAYQDWFSGRADQNITDAMKMAATPSAAPFGAVKPFAPNDQPFFAQDPYAAGNSFVSKSPVAEASGSSKFGERSAGSYEAKVKNQYSGLEQQSFGGFAGLDFNALSFADAMQGLDARSRLGSTAGPGMSSWGSPYGSDGGYSPNGAFGAAKGDYKQKGAFWALDNDLSPEELAGGGAFGGTGAVQAGIIGQFDAQAAAEINAAAAKWGVPAAFLMSIIAQESSGDWRSNNRVHPLRGETLLPYVGIFESTARSRGLNYQAMIGNRALQIDGLAQVLKSQYDQLKLKNPAYDWLNVSSYHYSGRPVADGWVDESGWRSNTWYVNQTKQFWGALQPGFDPKGGVTGGGSAVGMGGKPYSGLGIDAITRGNSRVSQGFGPNSFSMGAGAWMYGYAKGLGMTGHPGVDYSMVSGTPLYLPVSGTVVYGWGTDSFQY